MRKQAIIILVCLVALSFTFCNSNQNHEKQIQLIDSLKLELEKGIAVYKTIDTTKLALKILEFEQNMKIIFQQVKDTIDKQEGELLNTYKQANKPIIYLYNKNKDIITELELTKSQLNDLKTDINNRSIDDLKAFEFLTKEQSFAGELLKQCQSDLQLAKTEINRFDTINSKIKEFVRRYNSVK